jgi:uncharacterized membrane protein YfcA
VILFFANQGIDPREFRANIVLTLLVVGIVVLPSFFVGGVLARDAVMHAAQLLPASLGGAATGLWLSRHVSKVVFRRIALVVVLIAAGGAIALGALGL